MCHVSPGGVLCGVATWALGGGPYTDDLIAETRDVLDTGCVLGLQLDHTMGRLLA